MNEVTSIYDSLISFESKGKNKSYPIHKKLKFDSFQSIPDWLMSKVEFNDADNVLDVGCGTGHTLSLLNNRKSIIGKGISISPKEIAFANEQNDNDNLDFKVQNFDEPIHGQFDKIIAIESLKHSQNLSLTLQNLIKNLTDKGSLIIADDFINQDDLKMAKHKKYWQVNSFGTLETIRSYFDDSFSVEQFEFTDKVPTRSLLHLRVLITLFSMLKAISRGRLNRNVKTYIGGLQLESYYAKKEVSYHILIAKKLIHIKA